MQQPPPESPVRLTATVQGHVQGVGFRWSTMSLARSLDLVGVAENLASGDVQVIAEGSEESCQTMLDWLNGTGTRVVRRPGRVEFVDARWGTAVGGFRSFTCR